VTEHVIPGGRVEEEDAVSRPVLSRYARRATTPATAHPPEPGTLDPDGVEARPVDFEISARTPDLPDTLGRPGDTGPGTGRSDFNAVPDHATSEASRAAAATPRAAPDDVRRVEASEVHEAEPTAGGWMSALIPVPRDPATDRSARKKVPFWKRIALPRAQETSPTAATAAPRSLSLEPILTRLNALEKQLAANQSATESQLTRFEENITRLWELEEQLALTEVRERLALLEANQREIADALHTVGRNLTLLAVVLAAGLMAGLLALGLLL
jgi:hypothetical protein